MQAIAVTMTQWTGPALQIQVVPWMLIEDEASMHAFADAIDKAPRQLFGGGTSISGAIDHAMTLFPGTDVRGARRVIDVSGDGANNRGRPGNAARDDAVRDGATINGLPILALEPISNATTGTAWSAAPAPSSLPPSPTRRSRKPSSRSSSSRSPPRRCHCIRQICAAAHNNPADQNLGSPAALFITD